MNSKFLESNKPASNGFVALMTIILISFALTLYISMVSINVADFQNSVVTSIQHRQAYYSQTYN